MLIVLWPTEDTQNEPESRLLAFLRCSLSVKTLQYISDIMTFTPLTLRKKLPSSFTHFCHVAIHFNMMKLPLFLFLSLVHTFFLPLHFKITPLTSCLKS